MPGDVISLYRARLAQEKGFVRKDWGGKRSVALAYPNRYGLGMSNLGYQIVYQLLNARPDVVAERVFLPEGHELSLYLRAGTPLMSMETQRHVQDFDLLACSLSFENDYPNLLKLLDLARIPLLARERSVSQPLVMAGGITTFLNPEPLADFVDCFLLGEAEATLPGFMDGFSRLYDSRMDRLELLTALAKEVASLYVPALYEVRYTEDGTLQSFLPRAPGVPERIRAGCAEPDQPSSGGGPASSITTGDTEFANRVLIELGRGCGRSCRFCAAGYVYRPPRSRGEEELQDAVREALTRADQVGLLSPAVSDVPGVERITGSIVAQGAAFSVSSLRADTLTDEMLDHLKKAGQRTVAVAPEAGSERLRKVINKHLSQEQIALAAEGVARAGAFSLRLYLLVGLPTETHQDVSAIVDLVKIIKHHMVKASAPRGEIGRIKLSVNCFVPKPFTPFQWFPLEEVKTLKEKQKWLKKALAREGGITIKFDVPRWAYVQALLSLGDRRVGGILAKAHQMEGNWTRALKHSDVNPDFFVHRPRAVDELLPWDFIDHGISKAYLQREYELALKGRESDVCRVGECVRCGVCR